MSYSSPLTETISAIYQLSGIESLIVSVKGPPGMTGRLVRLSVVSTGASIANGPESIRVGTAADPDAYALISVPDGIVPVSDFVRGIVDRIPEDAVVEISEAGDSDFGPSVYVSTVIEWS